MKTLAVLSALVTIAIAAPAVEDYVDSTRLSPGDFIITQRTKKSTPQETQKTAEQVQNFTLEQVSSKVEPSNPNARTFSGFKKPIVVQKKIGYHVYRDSDEEQVDSQEKCRKQIKVKFCDENNSEDIVKRDHPHEQISETEMEHNINIAKEAVHTFERDLQRIEHECVENNKHRHKKLGSDTELHQDIEKARQALDHIQRKFKNLDSVTTTADESISNINLKSVKSDEERMIQWKEAGNLHKNVETARNFEDNFKHTDDKEEQKQLKFNNTNTNNSNNQNKDFKSTVDDVNAPSSTNNKFEDGLTSIVEDKNRKLEIHSDNLIKTSTMLDGDQQKEDNKSRMENHAIEQKQVIEKNKGRNNHELGNHNQEAQKTKDRAMEAHNDKSKFVGLEGNDLNLLEKQTRNYVDNIEMLKSSDDHPSSNNHAETGFEKDLQIDHSHVKMSHENDQVTHGSNHVDIMSSTNAKKNTRSDEVETIHEGVPAQNNKNIVHLDHDNTEKTTLLPKHGESINLEQLRNDHDTKKDIPQHMIDMDTQRSSATTSNLQLDVEKNNEKIQSKNHMNNHDNHELTLLRDTSDFHKELLNNMDFIEDPHHMTLHQPSLIDKSEMMKNEKHELHERLNVPRVQPNSEHLKTMMHFSDNPHHTNPHLKMASMFDKEEPNINVQFNSPQDFVEQTNIQEFPFRTTHELHDNTGLDKVLKTMHDNNDMPTELHDPLKVHWAHSDNMRMDGSSQHFNIEKLNPSVANSMNDQHLSFNEQIRAQQRWAHAKNAHQLSPMNTGFEHLHAPDTFESRNNGHNMMMHEKLNIDSTLQPSSFTQTRGTTKMTLEHPNQFPHTHSFRSSYGPSLSPPYGSATGSSYGGSAVGVFPNANVGNCAVPILLSCSPSVVSGTLSKIQHAYSAPSYRSEDINFLKKRGIDINEVTSELKLRHSPLGQRPNDFNEKTNR